jgi:TolB-like protein/DNA-binding winged helix-turn-helix (wHTH) protein/Tfp pilus assembly protein PilF
VNLPSPNTTHQFGDFEIQPDFNTITCDDVTSQLSPRVMDVLMHLIKNSDRVVPANELLATFWTDRVVEESTIHRHISQIRTALGDSAKEAKYIKTVSKRGYQAVAPIKIISAPPPPAQSDTTSASPYVFISYSHKDSNIVYKEIEWLENQGVKVWYDKGISPGSNWLSAIGDSLLGANTVLFFVSARSLASEHCNREVSLALDEGITIIPIYLDDTELTSDLKVGLHRVQALRLKQQGFRTQLLQTLSFADNDKVNISPVAPIRKKRPRSIIAAVAALALAIIGAISIQLFTNDSINNAGLTEYGEPLESIAVLPFTNLSARESVGFFASGLSDSILDELASIGHVKVAARTTTFQLAEDGVELGDMAKNLQVDYVLEGSVQEQDGLLRITTQLIRASDGFHVLSKTYQHQFNDSFGAQRQIGRNISQIAHDKIWIDLRQQFPDRFHDLKGIKREAVSRYLQAIDHQNENVLGEGGNLVIAMQLMERAAEIDPGFMMAHSDLAWNYMRRLDPNLSLAESSERAHASIQRMQALGANSSNTSFMLVQIYLNLDLDYASAEKLIEEEMANAPTAHWWRSFLADIAMREGRAKEALELIKADATLHPDFTEAEFLPIYAEALLLAGQYQEALRISDKALDLIHRGPQRAKPLLSKVDALLRINRQEEAIPLLEEAWDETAGENTELFALFFARMGQPERAKNVLETATIGTSNRIGFALGYESLGDIDTVFDLIQDGIQEHDRSIIVLMRSTVWSDAVLSDPRYLEMMDLLESKETHTPRYLHDHDASAVKSL